MPTSPTEDFIEPLIAAIPTWLVGAILVVAAVAFVAALASDTVTHRLGHILGRPPFHRLKRRPPR